MKYIETLNFKVALSYPGEKREYVRKVVDTLQKNLGQNEIFYDEFYEPQLARPDTDLLLQEIYKSQSELIIVFLSKEYNRKHWCGLEWRVIRSMFCDDNKNKIMLFRFDDEKISGLTPNDHAINAAKILPNQAAEKILNRLGSGTTVCENLSLKNLSLLNKDIKKDSKEFQQSSNWKEFFDVFSIWRARNLGLNINYSILIDCSGTMTRTDPNQNKPRIEHAKQISINIINNIHSEKRYDKGSVYSFSESLNLLNKSIKKQNLISKIYDLNISNRTAPTRLWDSLIDVIHKHNRETSKLISSYILVITDGYDNISNKATNTYPGCQAINESIEIAKQHNKICFNQILKAYKKNNHSLPFIFLVALAGNDERPIWSILKDDLNSVEFGGYAPISINWGSSIKKVKEIIDEHIIAIKVNLVRIGTVENWVYSLLNKELPIARSIIYPGALLATLIQKGDFPPSMNIGHTLLKSRLLNLMIEIKNIELFESLGYPLIEDLSERKYLDFLNNLNEKKLSSYTDLILRAAERVGWLVKNGHEYILEIVPNSLADYIVKEYFLSRKWESDVSNQLLKKKIMPSLRKQAKQLGVNIPVFTTKDIKQILL